MHATGTISFLTPRQQAWLEEQQQFVSSGLSAREFCKLHQLSTSTFYSWIQDMSRQLASLLRRSLTRDQFNLLRSLRQVCPMNIPS